MEGPCDFDMHREVIAVIAIKKYKGTILNDEQAKSDFYFHLLNYHLFDRFYTKQAKIVFVSGSKLLLQWLRQQFLDCNCVHFCTRVSFSPSFDRLEALIPCENVWIALEAHSSMLKNQLP